MKYRDDERQERIAKYKREAPIRLINKIHANLINIHSNLDSGVPYDDWQRYDMLDVLDMLDALKNRQSIRLIEQEQPQ